ncbi:MAG: T9SS type A sorting domain-containing protein [Bacteroidaceae bacterium]|nr:T9SS type A sorting domain-containing protein [Bacteroidaceae bacterium]
MKCSLRCYTNLELYLNYLVKDITSQQKRVPDFTSVGQPQAQTISMDGSWLSVQGVSEGSELAVYDCMGVPVAQMPVSGTAGMELPRGIYLVALNTTGGTLTQKVFSR